MSVLYSLTPRVGFEPTTLRLTAECSTAELSRKASLLRKVVKEGFIPSKPNTEFYDLHPCVSLLILLG